MEIHSTAREHGIADADIQHAVDHAMTIDDQDDDTRLYKAQRGVLRSWRS